MTVKLRSAGSGSIDVTELQAALREIGQVPTAEELAVMIREVCYFPRATALGLPVSLWTDS